MKALRMAMALVVDGDAHASGDGQSDGLWVNIDVTADE